MSSQNIHQRTMQVLDNARNKHFRLAGRQAEVLPLDWYWPRGQFPYHIPQLRIVKKNTISHLIDSERGEGEEKT